MKTIFIITILVVHELGLVSGFNFTDQECNIYLEKFYTANNPDGTGASLIAFTGDVSLITGDVFITGTSYAKVNLRYSDVKLFNDPTYFGLVKEDGKTAETVCLELKLWQFKSNVYDDPVQVTDLPITSSNNFQKQWRYYSFTIPGTEFQTRLVQTTNSNQFIYKGFYTIAFYPAGINEIQYTFYFQFSLTIDKRSGAAVDASFTPLSRSFSVHLQGMGGCQGRGDTSLNWCTDITCTAFAIPDLHLNDQFFLQQVITKKEFSGYYLTGTEVWYTGNGLDKRATPISMNNNNTGQVIIQLKAEIVWEAVTIKVISTLSTTQTGSRRMLVQTEYDVVIGETYEIECIKAEGAESCPTCEQQCDANGFAHDGCAECSFSQQIAFIFLILLLVFTI